ncbi:hypothetical protein LY78DRAFT_86672 [Colletotrichum sublineola]|nr:hypothetical protein LY78DRAFT_86672 [Colletotrichum sublineola]
MLPQACLSSGVMLWGGVFFFSSSFLMVPEQVKTSPASSCLAVRRLLILVLKGVLDGDGGDAVSTETRAELEPERCTKYLYLPVHAYIVDTNSDHSGAGRKPARHLPQYLSTHISGAPICDRSFFADGSLFPPPSSNDNDDHGVFLHRARHPLESDWC